MRTTSCERFSFLCGGLARPVHSLFSATNGIRDLKTKEVQNDGCSSRYHIGSLDALLG